MTSATLASRRTLGLAVLFAVAGAIVLVVLLTQHAGPSSARAADHLDAPGLTPPGGSVQTDITDLYAFQSPTNPDNTVLVLNVNGVASPGEAAPGPDRPFADQIPLVDRSAPVTYNFHVDNNGDAVPDVNIGVRFGKPKDDGSQKLRVDLKSAKPDGKGPDDDADSLRSPDDDTAKGPDDDKAKGPDGKLHIKVKGESTPFGAAPVINRHHDITVFAGRRDDPFFFDLPGFLNILGPGSLIGCGAPSSHPERDFFAHRNVSSIAIELPSKLLTGDSSNIGVWASTNVPGLQIDRMGRPAIATVFIPNNPIPPDRVSDGKASLKNTYNHSDPVNDQANFRGEIVDSLTTLFSLNNATDPNTGDDAAQIQGLANFLLPDILTVDTSSSAGFPNGRRLNDDVIDTELGLITEGYITTDCVPSDNTLLGSFPYLGNPN